MMMRLIFGAVLAMLTLHPDLAEAIATFVVQPPVLAFAAGVWAWPRITQRIKGWGR